MNEKPCEFSIVKAASALTSGELTVQQLVESCLNRIDIYEGEIQAWSLVDRKGAIETAQRLDSELKHGQKRSLLHGIPVGIKDIFYTEGMRTEAGSRVCAGFIPSYNATVVSRLKEAGAIILGKTRTTEFAYMDPTITRNPWNLEHTPGGSSSGSAAATAACMCLAGIGTQTLGSISRPAAYNGIVGFKPSYGLISTYGVIPLSWTLDHVGILARSIEDAAIMFQAMAGFDPKDHHSLADVVPDCLKKSEDRKPPRLGLAKEYFFEQADQEMRSHFESVVRLLRRAGADVVEISLPSNFTNIYQNGRIIMGVEAAAYHQKIYSERKDDFGKEIGNLINSGLNTAATDYAIALETRLSQLDEIKPLFYGLDALLTPGTTGAAPKGLAGTGNPVMQAPWTILGMPAISLPTGTNGSGLPLAIQLVGQTLGEGRLLNVARWCERIFNWQARPPLN